MKRIKVSVPMMLQQFHPCTADFIENVCHGRCCESSKGILVTIHASEKDRFPCRDGFMIPDERNLCPFKTAAGYCGTHMSKPFGCRVSPFTLNRSGTLIVRNRYRLLKCYKAKGSLPAWRAHSQSLREIIGLDGIAALINRIESNSDADLYVEVNDAVYQKLVDNDAAKRGIK